MVEKTTEPVEFVMVDSLGNKMIMLDLTPSPNNYRAMLSRIIEESNDRDSRLWASAEFKRIKDLEKWFVPRYECIEINLQELIATIRCVQCDKYVQGEVSEDQILSSEFFMHFGVDWEIVFRENVNDSDTLNLKKMRDAAVREAIIYGGWGHDGDYHDGSYKSMTFRN